MGLLEFACEEHTSGGVSSNPTVGVCWDSDRLNLWRVGMRPDPRWLSTAPAKEPARIDRASRMEGQHATWRELFEAYEAQSFRAG